MSRVELTDKAIRRAQVELNEAVCISLEHLIKSWALANGLSLDPKLLEQALMKLTEGGGVR